MCTEIIELVARAVSFHFSADTSYVGKCGKWVNIWLNCGFGVSQGLQYENIAFLLQATRFSPAAVCEALLHCSTPATGYTLQDGISSSPPSSVLAVSRSRHVERDNPPSNFNVDGSNNG